MIFVFIFMVIVTRCSRRRRGNLISSLKPQILSSTEPLPVISCSLQEDNDNPEGEMIILFQYFIRVAAKSEGKAPEVSAGASPSRSCSHLWGSLALPSDPIPVFEGGQASSPQPVPAPVPERAPGGLTSSARPLWGSSSAGRPVVHSRFHQRGQGILIAARPPSRGVHPFTITSPRYFSSLGSLSPCQILSVVSSLVCASCLWL